MTSNRMTSTFCCVNINRTNILFSDIVKDTTMHVHALIFLYYETSCGVIVNILPCFGIRKCFSSISSGEVHGFHGFLHGHHEVRLSTETIIFIIIIFVLLSNTAWSLTTIYVIRGGPTMAVIW